MVGRKRRREERRVAGRKQCRILSWFLEIAASCSRQRPRALAQRPCSGGSASIRSWPQALAEAAGRSEKPLKAAFSNAGLQATWCAQGKEAAEYWGKLFNVDVTWFDGQLDAVKQRAAIDNMASQKWDFVAIQAFGIGTLTAPVNKMIDAGIPVIDMDTLIAPLDTIKVLTLPRA